jgi:hypothetical protein
MKVRQPALHALLDMNAPINFLDQFSAKKDFTLYWVMECAQFAQRDIHVILKP